MTYEEEDVFAIAFLKGAASVDDVMNEAAMSEEEAMEGINSLVKSGGITFPTILLIWNCGYWKGL